MAKYKPFVVPFVIALLVLGCIAWGIGWLAHAAVNRATVPPTSLPTMTAVIVSPATPTTATSQPKVESTPILPTATLTPMPLANQNPTSTPQPTSTPLPEFTSTPYLIQVDRQARGVLDVCRKHCPSLKNSNEDLQECVRLVADLNELEWDKNGPKVRRGQSLQMPPECFSR